MSSSDSSLESSSFEENYGVHPLSYVIREAFTYKSSRVLAAVLLDIRTTDTDLIDKFGPSLVDFGGTFGVNFIPQDIRRVVDELRVVKSFVAPTIGQAEADATAWQIYVTNKVAEAIWAARAKSAEVGNSVESAIPV
jgi:hypothetical protein